ncbi:antibiotic biosynthesis monooxygenase [Demequina sp. SYSU T00192]|uniref:Antibiotic biosynthesis monooxygenase n=1 Tax=Demequina litoralis TaxID=3051660 RepID=A0ABT8GA18_9MICO|nr:antibiotic biosynthesis monooxygenase [Demequina sp. SYSU T00192]MDN4475966.1 antibiotic biosynthesis monooxygenase [Demequina sp. SYSU T00192]
MITESVILRVHPGREAAYEAAFREASPIIARQRGYLAHSLKRGIEDPATYLLTVEWETLEDHEAGFRGSADYQEWRRLLHPFYVELPPVPHYRAVDLAG